MTSHDDLLARFDAIGSNLDESNDEMGVLADDAAAAIRSLEARAMAAETALAAPRSGSWPDPHDFIVQLREAVGLFAGALPITPKVAWDEALAVARRAVQERDAYEAAEARLRAAHHHKDPQ